MPLLRLKFMRFRGVPSGHCVPNFPSPMSCEGARGTFGTKWPEPRRKACHRDPTRLVCRQEL